MDQIEKDVWAVIHMMEHAFTKDDIRNLTKEQLVNLLSDVYDMLGAIVM